MGLMSVGGAASTGFFGNVYFFYVWLYYNVESIFPQSLFSGVRYSSNNVFFTPIKSLDVVLHQSSSVDPHFYGKIKKSSASSYDNITDGMHYALEAGTEYTITYGRDSASDHQAFLIYASDK